MSQKILVNADPTYPKLTSKNILLFGGSGPTGQCFVKRVVANSENCMIYVVTRNPDTYSGEKNDNVNVIACNPSDADVIKTTIEEKKINVVINLLGFQYKRSDGAKQMGYLTPTVAMVDAMKRTDCKRLIVISTWFAYSKSRTCSNLGCGFWCFLVACNCCVHFGDIYSGHRWSDEFLQESKDLGEINYTSCRAPLLTQAPAAADKQDFVTEFDADFLPGITYQSGSFDCLARFVIGAIDNDEYKCKIVCYGRPN